MDCQQHCTDPQEVEKQMKNNMEEFKQKQTAAHREQAPCKGQIQKCLLVKDQGSRQRIPHVEFLHQ